MPLSPRHSVAVLTGAALCLALFLPASAHAALTISATRIIQTSDKQSTSVIVTNPSQRTYAAQAWVNTEADDTTTAVALIASPPLFRLDPGNEQAVQINRLPNELPQDRESLFFLNVQEIPQAVPEQQNALTIALRTRIKLFYRPAQLKDSPQERLKDLAWSIRMIQGKPHLVVKNPSPYHYTFGTLVINNGAGAEKLEAREMSSPMSEQAYPLRQTTLKSGLQVTYTTINDYGGVTPEVSRPVALH